MKNRKGDIKFSLSNISKAKKILKWKPYFNINSSCLNQVKWLNKKYDL